MIILVAIVHFLFLFFVAMWVYRKENGLLRSVFWPALFFKVISGFLLGALYMYYYPGGDTFNFFEDGKTLAALAREDFTAYLRFLHSGNESVPVWDNLILKDHRSLVFAGWTSIFSLITHDNYWIISVYFSLISFTGSWFLVRTLLRLIPQSLAPGVFAFLFFPSVVFWSSGLIKESLAISALYFLTAIFLKGWYKKRINILEWVLVPIAIWVLWSLKYFYAGVFFPVVITSLMVRHLLPLFSVGSHRGSTLLVWTGLFTGMMIATTFLHPNFSASYFFEVIVLNHDAYKELSAEESCIHYYNLQPTAGSIFINAPKAFFSGLFRPFVWEASSLVQWLSAIENSFLLLATLAAFKGLKKYALSPDFMLAFAVLVYVLLLAIFLSLSTPNFGTLSRYRIGFLPYYVFLIFYDSRLVSRLFSHLVRQVA